MSARHNALASISNINEVMPMSVNLVGLSNIMFRQMTSLFGHYVIPFHNRSIKLSFKNGPCSCNDILVN